MNTIYAILAGALLMLISFIGGCHYNAEQAEAKAASVRAQDVMIAKAMQPQIQAALTASHTFTTTIVAEAPHVTDFYVPALGAVSIPRPVYYLTVGSVRLWNAALGPATATGTPQAVTAADLALSPVSFDDAETNAILNFGQYRDCRTVVEGWQSWYAQIKAVKP